MASAQDVTRVELKRAVARYMGISRDDTDWTTEDLDTVNDVIKSGERMFYRPPVLPGERGSHVWSFLQPRATISVTEGDYIYDLPADFGGFITNQLSFSTSDGAWYPLVLTSMSDVLDRRLLDQGNTSDYPRLGAEYWDVADNTAAQTKKFIIWPTPHTNLTLIGQYYSIPESVDDTDTYPLGGQPHAETLREAVLAAAELETDGTAGPHNAKFMMLLQSSVSFDRQTRAKYMGNANVNCPYELQRHGNDYVTYNGVSYLG